MSYEKNQTKQKTKEATSTRQLKARVLEALKEVPLITYACQKLNIPKSTFYKWRNIDLKFKEEVDLAINLGRSTVNDMAISKLMKKINDGDTTSIIFWLKNNSPMFNQRMTLQIENKYDGYTKEELDVLVHSLNGIGYNTIVGENKKLTDSFKELLKKDAEEYNNRDSDDYWYVSDKNRSDDEISKFNRPAVAKEEPKPKPEIPKLKYGIKRQGINIAKFAAKLEAKKKAEQRKNKVNYKNIVDKMEG